ncbi:MAG: peptidoglycan DD-metalloendopeptidase family protein [Pseudomonadota bacterium]
MISSKNIPWQTIDLNNRLQKVGNLEDRIKTASGKDTSEDVKESCAEFESLLIYFVLKTMRDSIPKSGLLDGGMAEKIYTSMLDQELARKMAARGGIGLSPLLQRQLNGDNRALSPQQPETEGLLLPLGGVVSSSYGLRKDPITGEIAFHHGVDITGSKDQTIHASGSGEVVFSGRKGGYGNLVIIQHGDRYRTYYAHNSKNLVEKGDVVKQSQPVALMGKTGRATGYHVHFEVRRDGKPTNPESIA